MKHRAANRLHGIGIGAQQLALELTEIKEKAHKGAGCNPANRHRLARLDINDFGIIEAALIGQQRVVDHIGSHHQHPVRLLPAKALACRIPLLGEQRARLVPGEIRQAFSHGCATAALASHHVAEDLASRGEAEISQHHGDGAISPLLLLRIKDHKRLSHEALGLQAVVGMHPKGAVLHQ